MKSFIFILVVLVVSTMSAQAQVGTATSTVPVIVYVTNEIPTTVITMPTISTNTPSATAAKSAIITSGSALLGAFSGQAGGKFSISGRTLTLPAPEATVRQAGDWRRHLDFGMNQSKGNTETLRYLLGVDAIKEQDADLFRFQAKGVYGESSGIKDTENGEVAFRYERLLATRLYALGNLDWITDSIADLRYRGTAILSPGLRLMRTDTTLLNLEVGAGYIEQKKASAQDGYAAGRAAATLEWVVNAHVLLWCTGEYLPKLGDTSIFFVNAEAGIASYITRDLSLNVCYQDRYDSAPVEGKKNSDSILSTALSLYF